MSEGKPRADKARSDEERGVSRATWPYKCKQDILALITPKHHVEAMALLRLLEEMAEGRGGIEASLRAEAPPPEPSAASGDGKVWQNLPAALRFAAGSSLDARALAEKIVSAGYNAALGEGGELQPARDLAFRLIQQHTAALTQEKVHSHVYVSSPGVPDTEGCRYQEKLCGRLRSAKEHE